MKNLYKNFSLLLPLLFMLQPILLNSQSNQYLHFDKVDDFVILNEAGQYFDGVTEMTITGWFYCDELSYGQGYMGFRSGTGSGEFYLIQLNTGVMECRLVTTTGLHEYVTPVNTIVPQVWQHWAWVFDGSSITLYVNGILIGSSNASGTFSNPTVPFAIGKSNLGSFNFVYGGRIDEVSAWDKALSQSEIQDIMDDELTGNEDNLQLYYKMDQGDPGGDNTSITHLVCEIGSGERNAELMNFGLIGETSNFNGTLNPGYQAISFPQIANHLVSDPPFDIEATATSGLDVLFEIISGPATIDGNTITLAGTAGEVVVEATQPGNATFDPAEPVVNSFMVLDPNTHVPDIDARNPLSGDVYVPTLSAIQLAAISTIEYPELFYVQSLHFEIEINGEIVNATDYFNSHYVGWWTPPDYGTYSISIISTNNFGASATVTVIVNIVETISDMEALAIDGVWISPNNTWEAVEAELPCYLGAFDQITATLDIQCPPGGCGEWDRVAHVFATDHRGRRIEIIRYITPYGVPCTHEIDLTDYMSFLQGKITFEVACGTLDNGFEYYLTLNYSAGTPAYAYSSVDTIWMQTYQFGDYANLQPVPDVNFEFPDEAVASKLKLVSSGHGWGDLNTSNAAEFYEATHHIWINGAQTFEQHNWYDCNPNPDGCQPQNGTWYFDRAGWCPGAIAQWFDYDLTSYMSSGEIDLGYVFYPDYVDYCHPNHPDCVTGTTCSDCSAGFNPHLIVACNLVSFSEIPLITSVEKHLDFSCELIPNPTKGYSELNITGSGSMGIKSVDVFDATGSLVAQIESVEGIIPIDLSNQPSGLYFVKVDIGGKIEIKKIVVR